MGPTIVKFRMKLLGNSLTLFVTRFAYHRESRTYLQFIH